MCLGLLYTVIESPSIATFAKEDCVGDLEVIWCLKGALVHNITMALCFAPAVNKHFSLAARAETAAAGFAAVDLFRMISKSKAQELGVPTGSLFMAPQTCFNAQGAALCVLAMALSKPTSFGPWSHGYARVSEISIEQEFGFLRAQSSNSQLSARSFFQAAARQALKISPELNKKQKGQLKMEKCLTEDEPLVLGYSTKRGG